VRNLSASAYDDLRQCPYRFFALRQLGLKTVDELESEVDKRDFGLWLHAVLNHFHLALLQQPTRDVNARAAMLDASAQATVQSMALPEGEFLPFMAAWPAVRKGYLQWLATHEAQGAVFSTGETAHTQPLGQVKLVGRIDRIDSLPNGDLMVLDYKTEPGAKTKARVKDPLEDTQIAFYAALLPNDILRGGYINVGERDGTSLSEQKQLVEARDALLEGIQTDMQRIRDGATLPALGEGTACDFCQARGLCRKDFWT
jgi:ATP-dependent helicase/nuclease subunit B